MKEIQIRYFAALREQVQKTSETVLTESETVSELFQELKNKYNLTSKIANIRFAVNETYVTGDTKIHGGEQIVFIPPVAGG